MSGLVTAISVAAVGTAASIQQNRQAAKQQRKAQNVQSKIEARQMQRDRMQTLREAQIARATGMQMAVTSGSADSSGLFGSQAGMQATALGNLAFSQQVETGVGMINMYNAKAAHYQRRASEASAVSQLALSMTPFTKSGGKGG